MQTPIDKDRLLSKAKIALMSRYDCTFVSTIIMSLKHTWDNTIPTACTNGIDLRINEDFFAGLKPLQQPALLMHEAWHVALQHVMPDRLGKRDPRVYNMAADYVINIMVKDSGFQLGTGWLYEDKYRGMSTEEVYDILIKDPNLQPPNFTPDFEVVSAGGNNPAQQQQAQNQVKDILVRAATQAQMSGQAGSIPGDILVALDEILYPKLPWHVLLQDQLDSIAKNDYCYSKPNRRFMPDFWLPSLHSEGMGTMACAVDASGSTTDEYFNLFCTEIEGSRQVLLPEELHVVDFDTQINTIHTLRPGDSILDIPFKGRGGTDLQPVFDYYEKNPPEILIVFSDLECDPIEKAPPYPVIWVRTPGHGHTPTFGKLIEISL